MGSNYITKNICSIMHNQALDDLKIVYLDQNMYSYLMNKSYNNCCVLTDTINEI
jgi:hypothetical protein